MPNLEQYTTAEVAQALGVDRSTVRRMVENGRLVPVAKLPGRTGAYLFSPESIQALIDQGPTHTAVDRTPLQRRDGDQ